METRVAQVIDALVARTGALTGFRLATTETYLPNLATVWDGPEFRSSEDHAPGGHLVIGYGGDDPEALEPSATTTLTSRVMAAAVRPRDELGVINCRAISDYGDTAKQARDGALTIVTAVANLCRSDPTLGIDASATIGGVIVQAWVTAGTLLQYLQNGHTAEWEFTVTFKDRV